MASYEQRNADRAASNLKLQEVAELGQTLGFWTITKTTKSDEETWRFVEIVTPDNLHFELSGGSWNAENKIHASVGSVKIDDNVKAYPRDVRSYSEPEAPDAYVSKDKSAAQIVKDIKRRVIDNPSCIDVAKKINARIAYLQSSQSGLKQHVATLLSLGLTKGYRLDENSTYKAELYANGTKFEVTDAGRVDFSASINIAQMPALLALLEGSK